MGQCTKPGKATGWHPCGVNDKDAFRHEEPCLVVRTNSIPSVWLATYMRKYPEAMQPLRHAIGDSDFMLGCAANFLFDFSGMQQSLAAKRTLPSDRGAPLKMVGIHMRLGDEHMDNSPKDFQDHLDSRIKSKVRAALSCARNLSGSLFSEGQPWGIFLAVDSPQAKSYAKAYAAKEKLRLLVNEFKPLHSDPPRRRRSDPSAARKPARPAALIEDQDWGIWGDFLTLMQTEGLVSAGSHHSAAMDHHDTKGMSDYSQVPAQYLLMPFDRQRYLQDDQCTLVQPEDARVIV